MKKIIQILLIIVLLSFLSLIIIVVFNPFNLRTKMISSILDSYLSSTIENYESLDSEEVSDQNTEVVQDKNPLLSEDQEKTLESFGVDVTKLPSEITPEMEACFFEKLGEERGTELVNGATPTALDLLKAKDCINM